MHICFKFVDTIADAVNEAASASEEVVKITKEALPSTTTTEKETVITTEDKKANSSKSSQYEPDSSLTWSLGDATITPEAPVAELKTGKTIKSHMRPASPLSVTLFTSGDRGREQTSKKLHTMIAPGASVTQGAYESLFNR